MANSYNVNKLPDYVEQHKTDLIAKTVLGFKQADLFNLITDVKGDTALNLIASDIELSEGSSCGWDDKGSTSLSQRVLKPAFLKVNMSICDKSLLNKYAGYLVRIAADKTDRDLPFEQEFVDDVIRNINAKLQTMIWTGDSENGNEFDGFQTLCYSAPVTLYDAGAVDRYDVVEECIAHIPTAVLSKPDVVVFLSTQDYDLYMQSLVEKNLYHYNPGQGEDFYYHPGTNIRVIKTPGLETEHYIGGSLSNFYLGVDMMHGQEKFDLWYSKDNREFRLAIEFTMGVQFAYPEEVVLGTP